MEMVVVVVGMVLMMTVRRRRCGEAVTAKFNEVVFDHTEYCWIL
jgi:hypothetical protein